MSANYEAKLKRFQEKQARRKAREEKRAKEQQEKENRKLMSKSHRKEVAKRLKLEIDKTTDQEQLIKLTNAYAKVAPKRAKRAPGKPAEANPINQPGRLSKRVRTGKGADQLSDAKWLIHDMVVAIEKGAGKAEVYGTLSAEERALIEADEQEK